MYTFEKNVLINLSQQEVFDYVTDPANEKKWRKGSVSGEWTSEGPVGVGSTQHAVGKFLGRNIESDTEVMVWNPPNEYGWKSVGGPIPFEVSMKFTAEGDGTQLSFSGQAELAGFFKLAEGLAGKQLEKQIDGDFKNLKDVLEAG